MIGRAAFFAPLTGTLPESGPPPTISIESTPPCYLVGPDRATSGEKQPDHEGSETCQRTEKRYVSCLRIESPKPVETAPDEKDERGEPEEEAEHEKRSPERLWRNFPIE